jgi:hypothetical protein
MSKAELDAKISSLVYIIGQLSTPELNQSADPELLHKKFLTLQRKLSELTKLTNAGKAAPELRTKNLKIIKNWLLNYSTPADVAIEYLPKKYQNKNVELDSDALRQIAYFKTYIQHVIEYMQNLGPRYLAVKNVVDEIMEKGQMLAVHMDKFVLSDDDMPRDDYFSADDEYEISGELPIVSPAKMIKTIQTILNKYHHFSVLVSEKYKEIMPLIDELDEVDLGEFLTRTNKRNKLIKQLLQTLVDVNRILYQEPIPNKEHLREQYYKLVEDCAGVVPVHIGNRLLAAIKKRKSKGQFQTAIEQSLEGVRKYDPLKDPAMHFQSPHVPSYEVPEVAKKDEPLDERIDRKLRHQELADISQREGKPLSPDDKKKYEELWRGSALISYCICFTKLAADLGSDENLFAEMHWWDKMNETNRKTLLRDLTFPEWHSDFAWKDLNPEIKALFRNEDEQNELKQFLRELEDTIESRKKLN